MARKLDDVMAALPKARRERIEARAMELATLKDLRQAAQQPRNNWLRPWVLDKTPFPDWKSAVTCCCPRCVTM